MEWINGFRISSSYQKVLKVLNNQEKPIQFQDLEEKVKQEYSKQLSFTLNLPHIKTRKVNFSLPNILPSVSHALIYAQKQGMVDLDESNFTYQTTQFYQTYSKYHCLK